MSIVYIAGPITGVQNYRERFAAVATKLRAAGHSVLNPAELPDGLTEQSYMDIGLAMVRASCAIVMLEGWRSSQGATCEYNLAAKCQKWIVAEVELPVLLAKAAE